MFHKGALFADRFVSLEGDGKEARTIKFADLAAVEAKSDELREIAVIWCDMMDAK